MDVKSGLRSVIYFLIPRYPLFNALSLLMLFAERAHRETSPPYNVQLIYACVGLFFICGLGMSFKSLAQPLAIVHSVHLLCLAVIVYVSETLQYRYWVKLRMSHRMVGVAGYFMLFAYFQSSKPRTKSLRRTGYLLIGAYILTSAYVLLQSPEDKEAFLRFVPGSRPALFLYGTLLATVGLCFIPGQFVYDVTQALVVLLTLSTALIDARFHYWTKTRGIDHWNQVRMIGDNVMIIVGAVMFLLTTKKKYLEAEKED